MRIGERVLFSAHDDTHVATSAALSWAQKHGAEIARYVGRVGWVGWERGARYDGDAHERFLVR